MYEDAFAPLEPLDDVGYAATPRYDRELMRAQLSHADANLRMQAARAFCDIEDEHAIPDLVALLGDACPLVRVSAAYALGRNLSPVAVQPLLHVLQWDWNGYVRKGTVWALGNIADATAVPVLIDVLRHDITAVRLWAASALSRMPDVRSLLPLCRQLRDDAIAAVRSNCAWSLGRLVTVLGEPSASDKQDVLAALDYAYHFDTDSGVRDDAAQALTKLGVASSSDSFDILDALLD